MDIHWKTQLILIRRQEAFNFPCCKPWHADQMAHLICLHMFSVCCWCAGRWCHEPQGSASGNSVPGPWRVMCSPSTSFLGPGDQGNLFVASLEELVMDKHAGTCPVGIIHSKMFEHGWFQSELQLRHSYICQLYPYTVTIVIRTLSSCYPFSLGLCTPSTVFSSPYADGFVWGGEQ